MSNVPPQDRDESSPRAVTARSRSGAVGSLLEPMILTWKLFWDGRVGLLPKLIPLAAVIYLLSPLDFIPELALGPIGIIDDVGLMLLALNGFVAACPPDIVQEHRRQLGYASQAAADDNVVEGRAEVIDDQ